MNSRPCWGLSLIAVLSLAYSGPAADISELKPAERKPYPVVAPASDEAELAIKRFKVPPGFKVELVAAEPMLANPVTFCIDEKGRFYVSETHRYRSSVLDIRHYMFMLEDDMAVRTVEDREAMIKRHFGAEGAKQLAIESEVIRLVEDTDGDGKADRSVIYAEKFDTVLDGIASGTLARKGKVYFTNIPHLWELQDINGDGKADNRKSLSYGYGVRFSYTGHDMHGMAIGPDGKLYFSFGDRGATVKTREGKLLAFPDEGAVFRCNLDGSEMELVHRGLRNPQELAFDDHGNLFTGDNDSDQGDRERWVYVVEGGDSGWLVGYQHNLLGKGGPWNSEKLWHPAPANTAAYLLPPIALIGDGPSGLTFNPGTGFPDQYKGHFFLCHFKGSSANSGIQALLPTPKGASFELKDNGQFIWNCLPTDVDFGYDGAMYFTDWHHDWPKSSKGRIYRVYDPNAIKDPAVAEVKRIFAEGFDQRSEKELAGLLAHKDKRVRQEAQFALVDKKAAKTLTPIAQKHENPLARLHAIWGLGQLGRKNASAVQPLIPLLQDKDEEVRAQAAKVLGDAKAAKAFDGLVNQLKDSSLRVRFFAAMSLGKLEEKKAVGPLLAMIRENADKDLYLRHAGVMALTWISDKPAILNAAKDSSPSVRMASLLAMRRLEMPEIGQFLNDPESALVVEAARAINDVPIAGAMPKLAALIEQPVAPDALTLRVVNANFRVGQVDTARALARYATREFSSIEGRTEALHALGAWVNPHPRDRIIGIYRPLQARDPKVAVDALRPVLSDIIDAGPEAVQIAAAEAVQSLGMKDAAPAMAKLAKDAKQSPKARVAALKALETLEAGQLGEVVQIAVLDANELVRKEGTRLQAKIRPGDATVPLAQALERGTQIEKQGAFAALATVEGGKADQVLAQWLDKLLAGKLEKELHLDLLEAAAQRRSNLIQVKLQQVAAQRPKGDTLTGYRETLHGGNAEAGKVIFYERIEAACFRCHKIKGEGGEAGPPMDGLGTNKTREFILESILYPNNAIAEGFENWIVTMKNGISFAGILKSETDTHVVLNSPEDGILKLAKSEISKRERGLSGMPPEMGNILSKRDLRDLVEFLANLK